MPCPIAGETAVEVKALPTCQRAPRTRLFGEDTEQWCAALTAKHLLLPMLGVVTTNCGGRCDCSCPPWSRRFLRSVITSTRCSVRAYPPHAPFRDESAHFPFPLSPVSLILCCVQIRVSTARTVFYSTSSGRRWYRPRADSVRAAFLAPAATMQCTFVRESFQPSGDKSPAQGSGAFAPEDSVGSVRAASRAGSRRSAASKSAARPPESSGNMQNARFSV